MDTGIHQYDERVLYNNQRVIASYNGIATPPIFSMICSHFQIQIIENMGGWVIKIVLFKAKLTLFKEKYSNTAYQLL